MDAMEEVIQFWEQAGASKWFASDPAFDSQIVSRFAELHHRAARRELDEWANTPRGSLALVLLLDQFPRNMFRNSAHAYATDGLALMFADKAIAQEHDAAVEPTLRSFFYIPFEHSEDLQNQDRAVSLFKALEQQDSLDWAFKHREAIARFGRFPGRNKALGRHTTVAEQAWLDAGGGGFSG